jgi:hypothetical protein
MPDAQLVVTSEELLASLERAQAIINSGTRPHVEGAGPLAQRLLRSSGTFAMVRARAIQFGSKSGGNLILLCLLPAEVVWA